MRFDFSLPLLLILFVFHQIVNLIISEMKQTPIISPQLSHYCFACAHNHGVICVEFSHRPIAHALAHCEFCFYACFKFDSQTFAVAV